MQHILEQLRQYNTTLNYKSLPKLQKALVQNINEKNYFFGFYYHDEVFPQHLDEFLKQQQHFTALLPHDYNKLCNYLKHLQAYTCNSQVIRMDVRSQDFSFYQQKASQAIAAFYIFYGAKLSMKQLIYGEYRQRLAYCDMSSVIAAELLENDPSVIQACKDVLLCDNNTAIITRDVIIAIEKSKNTELWNLLMNLFLAAKLQEGLRQSIIETIDENQLDLFYHMINVIHDHDLLRYSSIQRGIMTWIGLGYEKAEMRVMATIFNALYDFIHHENQRKTALESDNPLFVYLALYCQGIVSLEKSVEEACQLLSSSKRTNVASALIYLKLTRHFDLFNYEHILLDHLHDEWIKALFISECVHIDYSKITLDENQAHRFCHYLISLIYTMKSTQTYSSVGFEWFQITLYKGQCVHTCAQLLFKYPSYALLEQLLPYAASYLSKNDIEILMNDHFDQLPFDVQKKFMLKEIISSNEALSNFITIKYQAQSLSKEDILQLESRLKTKKEYARANIIQILSHQSDSLIQESYTRLCNAPLKQMQEAAKELAIKNPHCFTQVEEKKILVQGKEEGFGLYTPKTVYSCPYSSFLPMIEKGFIKKTKTVDLRFVQPWSKNEILQYFHIWEKRIQAHGEDEYEIHGTYHQIKENYFFILDHSKHDLDALPLGNIWRNYFEEDHLCNEVLLQLQLIIHTFGIFLNRLFDHDLLFNLSYKDIEFMHYFSHFRTIFSYYLEEKQYCRHHIKELAALLEIFNKYCQYNEYKDRERDQEIIKSIGSIPIFHYLIQHLYLNDLEDEAFNTFFPVVYESYVRFHLHCSESALHKLNLSVLDAARAVTNGLLPKEALYEILLDTHTTIPSQSFSYYSYTSLHLLTEGYRDAYFHGRGVIGKPDFSLPSQHEATYQTLKNALNEISKRMLDMEATRINEKTPVSDYIKSLYVIHGVDNLILALHVLDHEEIKRQPFDHDRNANFAHVIRHCYPKPDDDPNQLANEHFSEKRLVEVAMMAPQWIDFINQVLNWNGFKEACYYFIAHMKQYNAEQKKAEIAVYTDLDPLDLNDGAFDMNWCQSIASLLTEKQFNMIYDASKFLCENAFHTRARKYADACLGRVSKEVYQQQALEKRNKDALNAYCICPLVDERDLLERYLFVQRFLKESKKYGAQRQASEKRACEIAFINLARNSRYQNITRLSWMMESELVSQYAHVLTPQIIDDMRIWICIDEQGRNEIKAERKGKLLKSIPASIKKQPAFLEINQIHQLWKEQYRRSKHMLEQAMEEHLLFSYEEISVMMRNPILAPMLSKLVLLSNDHLGFYENGKLKGLNETYAFSNEIRIAHAYDLYTYHCWHDYQSYLFSKQITQPFKQVFRELYLKLEDEINSSETKRYSGYQIQTKKAAAALKSRHWNATYEYGLEKVNYQEDLIVHLYADADWFSPSDIEAPSIDYVAFTSRKKATPLLISEINDITFSEIMRDVDLAVSTAYVGGVDPVTSFSTIELRKTIVFYTCQLMHLTNVKLSDHFANIEGKLNTYSVHLGSGSIHQNGGAAIHMVPVYSGQRGKVYLPFLDEDPMCAQILTKVILLAEDEKIKDPSILQQIILKN